MKFEGLYIQWDTMNKNRQSLAEALFKGHYLPTPKSCANIMGFE
jgi:hypothetical protein